MVVLRDMLSTSTPRSTHMHARQLRLNKYTAWRWRILVFLTIGSTISATSFTGVIEADESDQREARKEALEWGRPFVDPQNVPQPPRRRWNDFTMQGGR